MKIKLEASATQPELVAVTQGDDSIWMKLPDGEVIFLGPEGLEIPYSDDLEAILEGNINRTPVYAGEPITISLGV